MARPKGHRKPSQPSVPSPPPWDGLKSVLARAADTRATSPSGPPLGIVLFAPTVSESRDGTNPLYGLDGMPCGRELHQAGLCHPSASEAGELFVLTVGAFGPHKVDKRSINHF